MKLYKVTSDCSSFNPTNGKSQNHKVGDILLLKYVSPSGEDCNVQGKSYGYITLSGYIVPSNCIEKISIEKYIFGLIILIVLAFVLFKMFKK